MTEDLLFLSYHIKFCSELIKFLNIRQLTNVSVLLSSVKKTQRLNATICSCLAEFAFPLFYFLCSLRRVNGPDDACT